jgi:hypothetical protein
MPGNKGRAEEHQFTFFSPLVKYKFNTGYWPLLKPTFTIPARFFILKNGKEPK